MRKLMGWLFCVCAAGAIMLVIVASHSEKVSGLRDRADASVQAAPITPSASPSDSARLYVPKDLIFTDDTNQTNGKTLQPVIARALSAAPGAIVCPNMQATTVLFQAYAESWGEQTQEKMTKGQSTLVNGTPMQSPDATAYGCELVKPGTLMQMEQGNVVPVVITQLADGTRIRGVTLLDMLSKPVSQEDIAPGTLPMPELHNSPDLKCEGEQPCLDEQFTRDAASLEKRWILVPGYIQARCGFPTVADINLCIDQQTQMWKGVHPDAKTLPWMVDADKQAHI